MTHSRGESVCVSCRRLAATTAGHCGPVDTHSPREEVDVQGQGRQFKPAQATCVPDFPVTVILRSIVSSM